MFPLLILDSDIQIDDFSLKTKPQSYACGRRLYCIKHLEQQYWLKFHIENTHSALECAFQHEINFYQQHVSIEQDFLLPYQCIQFERLAHLHHFNTHGSGLLCVHSDVFFTDISGFTSIDVIRQKIGQVLDVLEGFYQSGWIHGDLKREHFRLYQNTCRLIDFEQSIAQKDTQQILTATPHYMAPELFQGAAKTVQSDLYALGIILFEWLTYTRLQTKSYYDWAVLHCQQFQLQLPAKFQCFVPLLKGLLEKRVERRLSSILEAKNCLNLL